MDIKLGMHMYLSVSMMTMNKKWPQALLPVTTSSLLKLVNHAMHVSKTWYACVFQRFQENLASFLKFIGFFIYLYTSISHDFLKNSLKSLIQEAYRVRDNTFLLMARLRGQMCHPPDRAQLRIR